MTAAWFTILAISAAVFVASWSILPRSLPSLFRSKNPTVPINDLEALGDSAYIDGFLKCALCRIEFKPVDGDFSTEATFRRWANKMAELAHAQGWRFLEPHGAVCFTCSARATSVI